LTNIIKARFLKDGQPHGKEYSYLTPVEVEVGDIAEMEARGKMAKGTVTQINVPESEIQAFKDRLKSIIGKVETKKMTIEEARELIESLKAMQENPEGGYVFPCPRCGHHRMEKASVRNALSRRADVYICSECGTDEAMRDMTGQDPMPLDQWAIVLGLDNNNDY